MTSRIHRSPAQWRRMLKDYDSSALSMTEFCQRRQVSTQSLYRWRKLLDSTPAADDQPLFAPVQLQALPDRDIVAEMDGDTGFCTLRIALGHWLHFELSVPLS